MGAQGRPATPPVGPLTMSSVSARLPARSSAVLLWLPPDPCPSQPTPSLAPFSLAPEKRRVWLQASGDEGGDCYLAKETIIIFSHQDHVSFS